MVLPPFQDACDRRQTLEFTDLRGFSRRSARLPGWATYVRQPKISNFFDLDYVNFFIRVRRITVLEFAYG